jgi:predicted nucleic acid-binding protein
VIVLDASAAFDLLAEVGDDGGWVDAQIASEREWHSPEIVDPEVLQALRRRLITGEVSNDEAEDIIDSLVTAPLARYPHLPLVPRAWELRGQLTAYDALYVALAEALGATLVTTDRTLARAVTTVEVAVPA